MKLLNFIFPSKWVLVATALALSCTLSAKPTSGEYNGLLVVVGKDGKSITGEFNSTSGGEGYAEVECKVYFYGRLQSDLFAQITAIDPSNIANETQGVLSFGKDLNGEWAVLKTKAPIGACARFEDFSMPEPVHRHLEKTVAIDSIAIVVTRRAQFFSSSVAMKPNKSYLVAGDTVVVLGRDGNRTRVRFVSENGKITENWLDSSALKP
jgi:hypothetical protein